jgi:hypothetical protein
MPRNQGADTSLALAFETVYGTAPVSGYRRVPYASTTLDEEQPLLASELLGFGRDPLAPTKDVKTLDGDVIVPIDAEAFGNWLRGAFGTPTTTGTGPYTHVFASGAWDLPSMSIETSMPKIPKFSMYSGIKVGQLAWTMQRGGLLTATVSLVGQKEATAVATAAGSPSTYDLLRFGNFHGQVSRNAAALGNVVSASFSYNNNLDPVEVIRSDAAIGGLDASMAMLSGELVTRFENQTLLQQAIDGVACSLTFGWSLSASASLTVQVPRVFLPKPRIAIPGPQGIQATFSWQAAQQTNGAAMCTVTLINSVASY